MRDAERSQLTVKDLVDEPDLGLTLVAGSQGLHRQVGGVHISEMVDPTPWLAPRDVLLTTGIRIRDDPDTQRELVRRLSQAGMAALAIAKGVDLEAAPDALRQAADEHGLPLLEVDYQTPFRAITSYIFTGLLSSDMHRLRRSLSVQSHLLSLMVEDRGTDHLVSSLSMLIGATVVVFDAGGQVVSQAQQKVHLDAAQTARIWQTYRDADRGGELPREIGIDHLRLAFREVRLHGRIHQVLALALPARTHLSEFADVVLTYAQKLLALDLLKSRDSLLLQRKLRADLLDELLQGGEGLDADAAESRLAAIDLDPHRDLLVGVVEAVRLAEGLAARGLGAPEQAQEVRHQLHDSLEATLANGRVPAITAAHGDTVVILLQPAPAPPQETRLLGERLRADAGAVLVWARLAAGFSEPFRGAERVARAAAQAREALRLARAGDHSGVVLFGELGPSIRLLENLSGEQLALFRQTTVEPLEEHDAAHGDQLVETLRAFLDEGRSVSRAAKRLFVHENTLRYRLKKIEALLGLDLDVTETLVDLYLGLRSAAILRARPAERDDPRPPRPDRPSG